MSLKFQIPPDDIIAAMQPHDVERLKGAAKASDYLLECRREVETAGDALIARAQEFEDARAAIPKRNFIDEARLTFDRPPPDMAEEVIDEPAPDLPQVMHATSAEPIVEPIISEVVDRENDERFDPGRRKR